MAAPPLVFPPENHLLNDFPTLAKALLSPSKSAPPSCFHPSPAASPTIGLSPNGYSGQKQSLSFIKALGAPPTSVQIASRNLKKSFRNMSEGPFAIPIRSPVVVNGKMEISFSEREVETLAQPLKFALVGKFSGRRPEFKLVCSEIARIPFKGAVSVRALKPGYVLILADLEDDFSLLWSSSKWFVAGATMRIFKWSPNFSYGSESSLVSVWVAFPDLPLHFFEKTALFSIAGAIGTPLKLDEPTANKSRPSVARVNVEVDLCAERVHEIWIKMGTSETGLPQRIIYENLPDYCDECKHRGHKSLGCKKEEFNLKKQAEKSLISKSANASSGAVFQPEMMTENSHRSPQNHPGIPVGEEALLETTCQDVDSGTILVSKLPDSSCSSPTVPFSETTCQDVDSCTIRELKLPDSFCSSSAAPFSGIVLNFKDSTYFNSASKTIIQPIDTLLYQHIPSQTPLQQPPLLKKLLGSAPQQQTPHLHQKGIFASPLKPGPSCTFPDSTPPLEPFDPSNINQFSTSALYLQPSSVTDQTPPPQLSQPNSAQISQLQLEGFSNLFSSPSRPPSTLQRSTSLPNLCSSALGKPYLPLASLKQPLLPSDPKKQDLFLKGCRNRRSVKAGPARNPYARSYSLPPNKESIKFNVFTLPKALARFLSYIRRESVAGPYVGFFSPLDTIQDPTSTPPHSPPSSSLPPQPLNSPSSTIQLAQADFSLPSHPVPYINSFFEAVVHPTTPKTVKTPKRITPVPISPSTSHAKSPYIMDKKSDLNSELHSQKTLVGLVSENTNSNTGSFSEFISDMGNSQDSTKSYAERLKIKEVKKKARRKGHHQG